MERRISTLRLALALMAAVLAGLLLVASAAELDDVSAKQEWVPQHANRAQAIETRVGQAFSISLPSGPQDHWQLAKPLDESIVTLVDTHVEPAPAAYTQAEAKQGRPRAKSGPSR
jgi:hypothetical protein